MANAPLNIMCCETQRLGRLKGKPCPNRATRFVNGRHVCGTHARLVPDRKREVAATGYRAGGGVKVNILFKPEQFEIVRDMASDRGASFASMTRTLVDYALDELRMDAGQNAIKAEEMT